MITEVPRPRFLIDENLSPELAARARARGYEAMALRDLGLLTERDWDLLRVVERDDWTSSSTMCGNFAAAIEHALPYMLESFS